MKKPKILVLKTDGINCDEELSFAFEIAGGNSKTVHVNDLRSKAENLKNYQILAIPGGFSYGDDVVSGKILAVELTSFLSIELKKFIQRKDTLIIGICNGFQVLVRTGLLPFGKIGEMQVTLQHNDSGHFECRWVSLRPEKGNSSIFLKGLDSIVSYQVAHGEGKFFASENILSKIEKENLVAFRYCDGEGDPTQKYPQNPNGSLNAIAGITDLSGRILGLMPHPERFVVKTQHPNWRRMKIKEPARNASVSVADGPQGLPIFENMIKYAKQS